MANWIAQATSRHKGALRKELHVPKGKSIPAKELDAAAKQPGTLGRRARLAKTLAGLHK